MFEKDIAGIILAAGYPSRLREVKPLMKLGGANVIERVTEALLLAGVYNLFLVAGAWRDAIMREYIFRNDIREIHYSLDETDLPSAVQTGTAAIPRNIPAFLLMPADCAAVNPATIKQIINFFKSKADDADIVQPVFEGRPGYPVLLSSRVIPDILSDRTFCSEGFGKFFARYPDRCFRFPVSDSGTVMRIELMSDYELMTIRSERYDLSNPIEGERLLSAEDLPETRKEHSRFVERITDIIGEELYTRRVDIDRDAARCAALLHDVRFFSDNPELAGKRFAFDNNLARAGAIIGGHLGSGIDERELTEKEIVFLADQFAYEDILVSVDRRFERDEYRKRNDGEALFKTRSIHQTASRIIVNIERVIRRPVYELLKRKLAE